MDTQTLAIFSAAAGATAGALGKALFDRLHARRQDRLAMGATVARLLALQADWLSWVHRVNLQSANKTREELYEIRARLAADLFKETQFGAVDSVIDSLGRWWPVEAFRFSVAVQGIPLAFKETYGTDPFSPEMQALIDATVDKATSLVTKTIEENLKRAAKKHSLLTWPRVKRQLAERQGRVDELYRKGIAQKAHEEGQRIDATKQSSPE